ncbi:family 16 glycosylhydrolase [Flavobacterium sp. UMI-01]|uniref:glycoside hydrolase family 16 protein n=1 Tax=Flavobacterium sp. UMI-01 TaxID=1441053 RepID=UPI001C7DF266|nr:glycoside hydrolase family 16 protein [Flavobacterium sp. UMI-01]GIZ09368.1 hypothetical protein FUMI01_20950 [Flavobacterium sp. UMI-01]
MKNSFVNKMLFITYLLVAFIFGSCSENNRSSPDDEVINSGSNPSVGVKPLLNTVNTSNWQLIFNDDFDYFDASKWEKNNSQQSRAPRAEIGISQWFWKPENVSYKNGNLVLKSIKVNANTLHCGSIYSNNLFEFKYGYIEARIEIAETMFGTHTALWLQGDNMGNVNGTGADGAEIDVFESAWIGDFTKSVVHIDGYGAAKKANTKRYDTPGIHNGYHTYGLLWNEDKLEIYYDGKFMTRYEGIWVPQVEEFLWLSTGASFGGVADFTSRAIGSFTESKVDYIRVWKMK